jgi:hypothetical protein
VQVSPLCPPATTSALRRLSVLVLPLVEADAAPGQANFADAVTDDITTPLSRIRGSFVIGLGTAMTRRGTQSGIGAPAREAGVRQVLQGPLERRPPAGSVGLGAPICRGAASPRRPIAGPCRPYWKATSAKLRSLRLCSRPGRSWRSNSMARMPMRRC